MINKKLFFLIFLIVIKSLYMMEELEKLQVNFSFNKLFTEHPISKKELEVMLHKCTPKEIIRWEPQDLKMFKPYIEDENNIFLSFITKLVNINDEEKKKAEKLKKYLSTLDRGSNSDDDKKKKDEVDENNSSFYTFTNSEFGKDITGSKIGILDGIFGNKFLGEKTNEEIYLTLKEIRELLQKINKDGLKGIDENLSGSINNLLDNINTKTRPEIEQTFKQIANLAKGLNEFHNEQIFEIINKIDELGKEYIKALNSNSLIKKLELITIKNITYGITIITFVFALFTICKYYLNNESNLGKITEQWLWGRAILSIFLPLLIGWVTDIIISANSSLGDFAKYNFHYIEKQKTIYKSMEIFFSFEMIALLASFLPIYKYWELISKKNIFPEFILAYSFFLFFILKCNYFNDYGNKQIVGIVALIYSILILYKLSENNNLLWNELNKKVSEMTLSKKSFFGFLFFLKWNAIRIASTIFAPYGTHKLFNFVRRKININIKEELNNDEYLKYDFQKYSNKLANNVSLIKKEDKMEPEEQTSEEIINELLKYNIFIKTTQKSIPLKNSDDVGTYCSSIFQSAQTQYYENQLKHKETLTEKEITDIKQKIQDLDNEASQ